MSRPWLALVLVLFCLPLFVNLGRADVQDDEAIYSFGVDRLLESGDWLAPKSSPHEDAPFLEKPPLKFWIVALPISAGLLPHHETGLRFWDALFGAIAFGYVFAIGSRLAGPVCGFVAVLILFVHVPLLFQHGLRTNNMEAPLFLSYCGGMFHYLEWVRRQPAHRASTSVEGRAMRAARPDGHAVAFGLYFVLGFMTKFVAAIFLPLTVAVATLLMYTPRMVLAREWRQWLKVGALVVAVCAPWFAYANWRFGGDFWTILVGQHVVTRFRTFLDPDHVQPWHFYLSAMWARFTDSGVHVIVAAGLAVLVVQTVRRRWLDGLLVLLWAALPIALISLGTSKIYHYVYPFLPPLALAGGYLPGLVFLLAPGPIARAAGHAAAYVSARAPGASRAVGRPAVRRIFLVIAAAACLIAAVSLAFGQVRVRVDGTDVFKSSGSFRPAIVALVFGVLGGAPRAAATAAVLLVTAAVLPVEAYHRTFTLLQAETSPKRDAVECIRSVASESGESGRGIYLDLPDRAIGHPLYYYFRRLRPWTRAAESDPGRMSHYLTHPTDRRPILTWDETYRSFRRAAGPSYAGSGATSIPMVTFTDDVLLLLPGPYARCSNESPSAVTSRR